MKNAIKVRIAKNKEPLTGVFNPKNPSKYVGDYPITFRSSWERKVMIHFDLNPSVKYWSSESIKIKYISLLDQKEHTYYPDFWVQKENSNGEVVIWLYEVKPEKQVPINENKPIKPETNHRRKLKNYQYQAEQFLVNLSKYKAAISFCKVKNWKFGYLTEKIIKSL